jgi:outer membrane protein OmpA-like peptidoglycan-associated protein
MRLPIPAGRSSPAAARLARCAAILTALAMASGPARAEPDGPRLLITYGPNEASQVTLVGLAAELDGHPLPLEKPAGASPAAALVYSGPLTDGQHRLQVTVRVAGDFPFFSYVNDYQLDLSGALDFASAQDGLVEVTARVRHRPDLSIEWQKKNALELSAVRKVPLPAPRAEEEEPPEPPEPAPLAGPAVGCALEPVQFGVESAVLTAKDKAALDRFAACLLPTQASVRLVGHSDSSGVDPLNQRLGLKRASAAAAHLRQRGLPAGRVTVESMGDDRTLCPEWTPACDGRNRRVEAIVQAQAR